MAQQTIQTFAQCDVKAVSVKVIKPYGRNPRRNDNANDNAVDAVAKSIELFGFRQPIVCDMQGVIVVGHTRYKAALKLGLESVPVVYADLVAEWIKNYFGGAA